MDEQELLRKQKELMKKLDRKMKVFEEIEILSAKLKSVRYHLQILRDIKEGYKK